MFLAEVGAVLLQMIDAQNLTFRLGACLYTIIVKTGTDPAFSTYTFLSFLIHAFASGLIAYKLVKIRKTLSGGTSWSSVRGILGPVMILLESALPLVVLGIVTTGMQIALSLTVGSPTSQLTGSFMWNHWSALNVSRLSNYIGTPRLILYPAVLRTNYHLPGHCWKILDAPKLPFRTQYPCW